MKKMPWQFVDSGVTFTGEGSRSPVGVAAYGTRTDDPCVVVKVGAIEVMTNEPEDFFEQVARAKALWDGRTC